MEYVTLNNGIKCPAVGIGTFMLAPADFDFSMFRNVTITGIDINAYGARGTFRMKGTHHYELRDGDWIAVNGTR